MDIYKKFDFLGLFKKLHEEDRCPIENLSACILCYKNGDIFLEVDENTNKIINQKRGNEFIPISKTKNLRFSKEQLQDPIFSLPLPLYVENAEKELVQSPYQGDYTIEGSTPEGWFIKAKVADPNFRINLIQSDDKRIETEDSQKYFIELKNLYIDYHPQNVKGKQEKALYGVSNLRLDYAFATAFLDSKYEIRFTPVVGTTSSAESLSAEVGIEALNKDTSDRIEYKTYFAWFELLVSFATGKCLEEIYRIEIFEDGNEYKKVEYWSGEQFFEQKSGVAVIQKTYLPEFIQQCASAVTWENFSDKGLGSALRWYTKGFSSNSVSVSFILFCTVLETLNRHYSVEVSSRLLPRSNYREIREKILGVLKEYGENFNNDEIKSKYEIFRVKVEKSFADGSFNQIGSLATSLKLMLEDYKTPYKDLFQNLEFIGIRNNIVHTGFGGDNIFPELRKLANLVVRLILSMLQYQGNYIESEEVEIADFASFKKYSLAHKTFPFQDNNPQDNV